MVERLAVNQWVAGSSPAPGANFDDTNSKFSDELDCSPSPF